MNERGRSRVDGQLLAGGWLNGRMTEWSFVALFGSGATQVSLPRAKLRNRWRDVTPALKDAGGANRAPRFGMRTQWPSQNGAREHVGPFILRAGRVSSEI